MGISHWELIALAVVIVLLFGGSRLPGLMRNMGRSITEFKSGLKDPPKKIEEHDSEPVSSEAAD